MKFAPKEIEFAPKINTMSSFSGLVCFGLVKCCRTSVKCKSRMAVTTTRTTTNTLAELVMVYAILC